MKHFIFLILLNFPFLVTSQVAITFSDNFNLEDSYVYDNWEYSSQSFFVLPLSINDFIPIESYQFNVLYDPQVVQLDHNVIDAINKEDITSSYGVSNAVSGLQGQGLRGPGVVADQLLLHHSGEGVPHDRQRRQFCLPDGFDCFISQVLVYHELLHFCTQDETCFPQRKQHGRTHWCQKNWWCGGLWSLRHESWRK